MIILKKYSLSIIFIVELILFTMTSTWTNEILNIDLSILRLITVLQYSPLIIVIIIKTLSDLIRKSITKIDLFYYAFLIYYVILTTYRLFTQMEIKENFYYTLVLLGTWSFWIECKEKKIISTQVLSKNLVIINISIILYSWIYFLYLYNFIAYQPININLTSISILLMLPFILYLYNKNLINFSFSLFILSANITTLFLSGSRIVFVLTLFLLMFFILLEIKKRSRILVVSYSLIISIVVITCLYMFNISNTRYSVDREFNAFSFLFSQNSIEAYSDSIDDKKNENNFDHTFISYNDTSSEEDPNVTDQIQNSDNMRKQLWEYGIEQVKKNFFFGTGDVEIEYAVNEKYMFKQSPHNFILESLICYGFVGTLVLFIFACFIVYSYLQKMNQRMDNNIFYYLFVIVLFYTSGFVEPIVYNLFTMIVFMMINVYFTLELENLVGDKKNE